MKSLFLLAFLCTSAIAACALPEADAQSSRLNAAAASPSTAQAREAVPPQLEYFIGTWIVAARDPSTNNVTTITYRVEPSTGGRWLAGSAESSDLTVRAQDIWGIDPASGEILRFVFDGSGAFGSLRSRGWEGERLVFEGEAQSRGGPTQVRETITRISPQRFEAVWESLQNGSWRPYSIEQVTRQ